MCALLTVACHESLEQRAQREAKEYTRKLCPTPFVNNTRTDSLVFDMATRTYLFYCSVNGFVDDQAFVDAHKDELTKGLIGNLREDTDKKIYKDAGFSFAYVMHSAKNPKQVLYKATFTPKDYE